jgi:1-deoxy-D-xylulose-5-phosphate synthase
MPLPPKYSQYQELRKMPVEELVSVAAELRSYLINTILENGGHFAANLGVIELTVAILSIIDPKKSPVIWDVGHQSYPYKVLTGRADEVKNIRNKNGISGFPKRSKGSHWKLYIRAIAGLVHASRKRYSNQTPGFGYA